MLKCVSYVGHYVLVMYNYMLLPFDIGNIYLQNVNKCTCIHPVNSETRINLI